jgi:AcrR family transcriptional regulator
MRRLAERCGYTAPTIYHYFGDKKGLFDSLLEERFARMVETLRRVRRSDDPVQTLLAIGQAAVRFGLRNPSQIQLLTALRPDPSDPPQSSVEARELLEAPLAQLEREGRLLTRDTEEAFQCLWIAMHGAMSMLTTRPDYEWSKNLVRTSLAAMLRGLVAPAGNGNASAPGGAS